MAALYQYRSVAYDMKIEKVVKSPYNELILFEGDYDDCNQGDDLLFEFPDHLVKDPFDAAAMLTYMACQDAFNFLYELSRDLLQDITTTIQETSFSLSRDSLRITSVYVSGEERLPSSLHSALVLEAKDGEAYILDVAGAQFGQYEPVLPFNEYLSSMSARVRKVFPHGDFQGRYRDLCSGKTDFLTKPGDTPPNEDYRIGQMQGMLNEQFCTAVKEWELENKLSVKRLLRLDQKRFEAKKESLLAATSKKMADFIIQWLKKGSKMPPRIRQPQDSPTPAPVMMETDKQSQAYRRLLADEKRREMGLDDLESYRVLPAEMFGERF